MISLGAKMRKGGPQKPVPRLLYSWVVHTVGPVWSAGEDRSELLADCHRNALRVAADLGAATVAFPAISTGIYRWPMESAAEIALTTVSDVLAKSAGTVREVVFALRGDAAMHAFLAQQEKLG